MRTETTALLFCMLFTATAFGQVSPSAFANFEGALTNPVRVSADGTLLFAVDTPDARLSVFSLANPASPTLTAEIPVGIEPVSVNPRTNNEVWVVNQESDSISVVNVALKIVTDTIYVKDEPADVVFAGSYAFVSEARNNQIQVFNASTHALVTTIPLFGSNPRAMAVSKDGTKVYAAFALSGNHSTIIPTGIAPPPPPPTNPALPPAPNQGIIVDASDPSWYPSVIKFTMPDNDVVEINAATFAINRYFSHVGTINLGLAINPVTNDIWVANTDALNLVRFEPNLDGHYVNNRMSKISFSTGAVTAYDLNPGVNYQILPNPAALSTAIAQPAGTVFDPSGNFLWVAAFGTDRVAKVSASTGAVMSFIEIGNATGSTADPANKRGPRGLALNAAAGKLYVLNRISNTLSTIDTSSNVLLKEQMVGSYDPTPTVIKSGRGFLYDAKLSGNGSASCAGCHVDAEMDLLAWDLGNPNGNMTTVTQGKQTFTFHPMKGPMVTQTLRGLNGLAPYHWRGDKANFAAFNPAFQSLMGGSQLSSSDMTAFTNFINTVLYMPNPNQNLDRTLPVSFGPGNPQSGLTTFLQSPTTGPLTCNTCHTANPGPGSNLRINALQIRNESQPFKVTQLRDIYQKTSYNNQGPQSIGGFGLEHEGVDSNLTQFLTNPAFTVTPQQAANMGAYLLCFDTGTAPAVGYTTTLSPATIGSSGRNADWATLQSQALAGNIDLIGKGTINGVLHGLLYQPATFNYKTDTTGLGPFKQSQLETLIQNGDTISFMGVYPGTGYRMGIDRENDGCLDGDPCNAARAALSKPTNQLAGRATKPATRQASKVTLLGLRSKTSGEGSLAFLK